MQAPLHQRSRCGLLIALTRKITSVFSIILGISAFLSQGNIAVAQPFSPPPGLGLPGCREGAGTRSFLKCRSLDRSSSESDEAPTVEIDFFYQQGKQLFSEGDFDGALAAFDRALEVAQLNDDTVGQANALNGVGLSLSFLRRYVEAIDALETALTLFEIVGNPQGVSNALNNLGETYFSLGLLEDALDYYRRSLAIRQQNNWAEATGESLHNIALVYAEQGDIDRATAIYQDVLEIAATQNNQSGVSRTLNNLAYLRYVASDLETAKTLAEQAVTSAQRDTDRLSETYALFTLGLIYGEMGEYNQSLSLHFQAINLARTMRVRGIEALALHGVSLSLESVNQPELAIFSEAIGCYFEEIRASIEPLGTNFRTAYTLKVADTYRLLADLLLQQNRIIEAQRVLDLLKVQELDEYLEDVQRSGSTAPLDYWQPEEDVLALYDDVLLAGTELARLQDPNRPPSPPPKPPAAVNSKPSKLASTPASSTGSTIPTCAPLSANCAATPTTAPSISTTSPTCKTTCNNCPKPVSSSIPWC
ncbi:MAG: tetratricopeptide repeat protein [Leptolyngbya sp. RL_3_1]|nr:tetratricopeptide repeat protein [Leptolyngbya sp. RL_3_1]